MKHKRYLISFFFNILIFIWLIISLKVKTPNQIEVLEAFVAMLVFSIGHILSAYF